MSGASRNRQDAPELRGSQDRDAARVRSALTGGAKRASAYNAQPEGRPSVTVPAEGGAQPAQRAAAATPGIYPRSVTPGIETQGDVSEIPPEGVSVGLDWMRFTAPDQMREELRDLLETWFPEAKPEQSSGAKYFKHGLAWKPGVLLSWGHSAEVCMVDVQGGRLRLMSGGERIRLFRCLMDKGIAPTRLDGAIDFVDQALDICGHAEASCRSGELCRVRRWSPNNEYESNGIPTRLLLKLGSRESPVCGRIYDKGLEQRAAGLGRWERVEIEWKDDRAATVAHELYHAANKWPATLASLVFGAIDFRESNGRSELARRPRVAWWERVIAGHKTVAVSPAMEAKTFERWHEGLVRSYGRRLLEMADAVGKPVGELVTMLLAGVTPSDNGGALVTEFVPAYRALSHD